MWRALDSTKHSDHPRGERYCSTRPSHSPGAAPACAHEPPRRPERGLSRYGPRQFSPDLAPLLFVTVQIILLSERLHGVELIGPLLRSAHRAPTGPFEGDFSVFLVLRREESAIGRLIGAL